MKKVKPQATIRYNEQSCCFEICSRICGTPDYGDWKVMYSLDFKDEDGRDKFHLISIKITEILNLLQHEGFEIVSDEVLNNE